MGIADYGSGSRTTTARRTTTSRRTPARKPTPKKPSGIFGAIKSAVGAVGRTITRTKKDWTGVVRSLSQLPSTAVREFNEGLGYVTGASSIKPVARFLGQRVPGQAAEAKSKPAVTFSDTVKQIKKAGHIGPLFRAPGVRVVTGAYTAANIGTPEGRKELGEHPGYVILDLLPFASKGSQVVTRGSRLAARAAETAVAAGRAGKAARITRKGLRPHEAVMQLARDAERVAVERRPSLYGKTPSAVLERSGLGGARARRAMEMVGVAQRRYTKDLANFSKRVQAKRKEFGLGADEVEDLTRRAEAGEPGWRANLTDNEGGFMRFYESEVERLRTKAGDEFFDYRGTWYAKSQHPNFARRVRRLRSERNALEDLNRRYLEGDDDPALPARLTQAAQRHEKTLLATERQFSRTPPASFRPMLLERIKGATERIVSGRTNPADWDTVLQLVRNDLWEEAGISRAERLKLIREVSGTWTKLRDQGYDPVFVHHLPIEGIDAFVSPRLMAHRITRPSDVKRLAWDMRPWVHDASVALTGQAADWLRRDHSMRFVDDLQTNGIAKTWDEVRGEVTRWAQRGAGKGRSLRERVDNLLKENFEAYDPNGFIPLREAGVAAGGARAALYLPRGVANALEHTRGPKSLSSLGSVFRGGSRLFRMSVLYLNPFYYIDNAVSGAILVAGRGKVSDLRFLPRAIRMLRKGELPEELAIGGPRMGAIEAAEKINRARAGWVLGDELVRRWGGGPGKVRGAAVRGEEFLQNTAAIIDDMWKATAYLAELRRATRKGISPATSLARAVEHAHKVLGNIDNLMPFERFVVRQAIPFYSWSKFIASYVMTYPFDHPWRASIISGLGRAAREDMAQRGLPERFLTYFWLGQPKKGMQKLLPASGVFPFVPVADMFSLTGLAARLDPRIQALMEAYGFDPFSGGPDIFRETTYDPVSGREVPQNPNIFRLMAQNLAPRPLELLLMDEDLKKYYEENPDRFNELLWRTLAGRGISTRNIADEVDKARRNQARSAAKQAGQLQQILVPTKGTSRTALERSGAVYPMKKRSSSSSRSASGGIAGYR